MDKVFGIGWHRTGTKSLHDALTILGYNVSSTQTYLVKEIANDNVTPALNLMKEYDACRDFPWPLIFKELDCEFPNSKFIATIRDEKDWLKSILNKFGRGKRESLQLIYGASYPKSNENIFLNRYKRHNFEIFEYFRDRPNDLLVLNFSNGDGWQELCTFLDKKVPTVPFPHRHESVYGIKKYGKKHNRLRLYRSIYSIFAGTEKKIIYPGSVSSVSLSKNKTKY